MVFHLLGLMTLMLVAAGVLFIVFAGKPIDLSAQIENAKAVLIAPLLVIAVGSCAGWGIATQYHIPPKRQAAILVFGGLICGALMMVLIAVGSIGSALIEGQAIEPSVLGWLGAAVLYPFFAIGSLLMIAWSFIWAPFYRSFVDFE